MKRVDTVVRRVQIFNDQDVRAKLEAHIGGNIRKDPVGDAIVRNPLWKGITGSSINNPKVRGPVTKRDGFLEE